MSGESIYKISVDAIASSEVRVFGKHLKGTYIVGERCQARFFFTNVSDYPFPGGEYWVQFEYPGGTFAWRGNLPTLEPGKRCPIETRSLPEPFKREGYGSLACTKLTATDGKEVKLDPPAYTPCIEIRVVTRTEIYERCMLFIAIVSLGILALEKFYWLVRSFFN